MTGRRLGLEHLSRGRYRLPQLVDRCLQERLTIRSEDDLRLRLTVTVNSHRRPRKVEEGRDIGDGLVRWVGDVEL